MQWTRKSIAPPLRLQGLEHHVDGAQILDVAGENQRRAKASGQRLDPFAERFALIGERQLRALVGQSLGDAPGDRVVVRDAHHQAALAVHQSRFAHARLAPGQASMCLNTIAAFVPPNPNEFDSTAPSLTLSRRARTMGMSAKAGSISSIWALSQIKPFCIISRE